MWWNDFWPGPWMFFGPMMMFLLMIVCMVGMFFMMRMGSMHRATADGPSEAGLGFGQSSRGIRARLPADRPGAFEENREEALRRLDQEQKEFQAFVSHLRSATDKAEFDQFMAEHRGRASQA